MVRPTTINCVRLTPHARPAQLPSWVSMLAVSLCAGQTLSSGQRRPGCSLTRIEDPPLYFPSNLESGGVGSTRSASGRGNP